MNKNEKTALPQLRFRQFKDNPAWSIDKFGSLIVPVEERAGTKKYTLMSVTSGVGLIPQIEKFGREIAGSSYKNYYVIKKNDFAYNKSATKQFPEGYISMLSEYEEAALPNSIFTCFRVADKECDPRFFDHLFHNNYHGAWLRKYIEVGARAHGSLSVDTQHLWDMPIALPRIDEQQKIADCLSSLDDLITAEDKKLEALKAHKKGLMQKLFPAKGATVPEWRFPEFRDAGEWEEKPLSSLCRVTQGGTPSTSVPEFWGGNIQWVTPAEMGKRYNKYITDTVRTLTDEGLSNCSSELLPVDSVIVSTRAPIGLLAINKKPMAINQGCHGLIPLPGYNTDFIFFSLEITKSKLNDIGAGNTFKELSGSSLKAFPITVPELPEQQKIADCLSSLDDFIAAENEKLEALKAYKKGLMQGLFPSIEEVAE